MAATLGGRRALHVLARRAALRVSRGDRAAGRDAGVAPAPLRGGSARYGKGMTRRAAMRRGKVVSTPADVRELIEHELALIAELEYEPYFLTVHDIVAFARCEGHPVPGPRLGGEFGGLLRLGITEVDPARMSMLFERFISKERNEPPDIDVDFEHQRREEVMQYVYAKYGRDRAALAATSSPTGRRARCATSARRSASTSRRSTGWPACSRGGTAARSIPSACARPASIPTTRCIARLVALTGDLMGFPRHLSQHVGGFVIARGLLERWCRSKTPRWRTAPSSSGTRTTSTRWACSRSIAWRSACSRRSAARWR